jgi:hypothetical protein
MQFLYAVISGQNVNLMYMTTFADQESRDSALESLCRFSERINSYEKYKKQHFPYRHYFFVSRTDYLIISLQLVFNPKLQP